MSKIKFGTDGWRAIIAQEYTVDNVKRVTEGTAKWMQSKGYSKVVIGHDCRFAGQLFAETATKIMGAYGIKVHLAKGFVSTPMVSLGVVKTKSDLGIVITASHNPPSYNGFKLKSNFGGPSIPRDISAVEEAIPSSPYDGALPSLDEMLDLGLFNYIDLEGIYMDHIKSSFDLDAIRQANIGLAYDAMYGAGMNVIKKLFPGSTMLHCEYNPSFMGQAPEPIHRNLGELAAVCKNNASIDLGLANDGDADRIGLYDEDGNFVDSHHILNLLLLYLKKYKEMDGNVVVTFSVTDKMRKLAEHFGLDFEVTKIGFKYIAEIMTHTPVLVGGEESGGLAVAGHIPERDGIWIGLVIMEFMAKTGKSLKALIQEVYDIVGPFALDRDDLHLTNERKLAIVDNCKNGTYTAFGDYKVERVEDLDGHKFHLGNDEWVMMRPSGTEPVLRVYAQSKDQASVRAILDATHATLNAEA